VQRGHCYFLLKQTNYDCIGLEFNNLEYRRNTSVSAAFYKSFFILGASIFMSPTAFVRLSGFAKVLCTFRKHKLELYFKARWGENCQNELWGPQVPSPYQTIAVVVEVVCSWTRRSMSLVFYECVYRRLYKFKDACKSCRSHHLHQQQRLWKIVRIHTFVKLLYIKIGWENDIATRIAPHYSMYVLYYYCVWLLLYRICS